MEPTRVWMERWASLLKEMEELVRDTAAGSAHESAKSRCSLVTQMKEILCLMPEFLKIREERQNSKQRFVLIPLWKAAWYESWEALWERSEKEAVALVAAAKEAAAEEAAEREASAAKEAAANEAKAAAATAPSVSDAGAAASEAGAATGEAGASDSGAAASAVAGEAGAGDSGAPESDAGAAADDGGAAAGDVGAANESGTADNTGAVGEAEALNEMNREMLLGDARKPFTMVPTRMVEKVSEAVPATRAVASEVARLHEKPCRWVIKRPALCPLRQPAVT